MGPIIVIVGMLLMVVIHEAGHFIMAKYFDMKATEAFFGFGPRIWSTTRGETEYGIKGIPLGGYVRIVGMNPFEEIPPEEEHRTYRGKPFWQKTVVVLAGIVSHFVIAFILFYIGAVTWSSDPLGLLDPSTTVESVGDVLIVESGAETQLPLELQSTDSVLSIDGVPLAEVPTLTDKVDGETTTVVVDRDGTETRLETTDFVVPTPAYVVGIREGDRLVAVDGIAITDWEHFVELAHERPGQLAAIDVERDSEFLTYEVVLAQRSIDGKATGFVGVSPARSDIGPVRAIGVSATQIGRLTVLSLQGLGDMVTKTPQLIGAVFGQDTEVLEETRPVSVIGVARIAGGLESALFLLAYVNVFVGTLNFIPLYPLDGGHFAVALYEKIRGRQADVRRLIPVAVVVFMFIMFLGVLGIYFDIVDPLPVAR